MKRLLICLMAAVMLSANTVFAGGIEPTSISSSVQAAFNESFAGATDVKWYTDDNKTYTARFTMLSNKVTAFFDSNGELLATSRYLQKDQLPLPLAAKLEKKYPGQEVYCIVEYTSATNPTHYVITFQDENYWTVVKGNASGQVKTHQHFKKA